MYCVFAAVIVKDLQSVVLYDSTGKFAGVRRPGSNKPITVDGVILSIDNVIGSTGLEIKNDPGVPLVYAGFGGLMITTLISYVSHSQVWGLQQGSNVYVAGRSNRSKVLFEREMDQVLDAVPEVAVATQGSATAIAQAQVVLQDDSSAQQQEQHVVTATASGSRG